MPVLNQLIWLERSKRSFTVMKVFGLLARTEITSLGKFNSSLTVGTNKSGLIVV